MASVIPPASSYITTMCCSDIGTTGMGNCIAQRGPPASATLPVCRMSSPFLAFVIASANPYITTMCCDDIRTDGRNHIVQRGPPAFAILLVYQMPSPLLRSGNLSTSAFITMCCRNWWKEPQSVAGDAGVQNFSSKISFQRNQVQQIVNINCLPFRGLFKKHQSCFSNLFTYYAHL